jgi:hypothetical protein
MWPDLEAKPERLIPRRGIIGTRERGEKRWVKTGGEGSLRIAFAKESFQALKGLEEVG